MTRGPIEEGELCPNCGEVPSQDSADVGVGIIYGPAGCSCGWSEWPEYNQLTGPKESETHRWDQYGVGYRKEPFKWTEEI